MLYMDFKRFFTLMQASLKEQPIFLTIFLEIMTDAQWLTNSESFLKL